MHTTTIGQLVWFLSYPDRRGPFPATVITPGSCPLLSVEMPEGVTRETCSHWLEEDGTETGWLEIPADGAIPPDLF